MQDGSFGELLFSKDSIAGVWAVIGALVALLGVFANNLWENSRKKKEREHALIRDAYYGAVEYINYYAYKILSIGQSGEFKTDSDSILASEKFSKLFLVASPQVIDTFTKLSLKFTDILMRLGESALILQNCNWRVKSHQQVIDNALSTMNLVNVDMKEYNDKNRNIPELWNSFSQRYEQAQQNFDLHSEQIEILQKQEFELKIKLLKECIELLLTTYSDTYEAIFLMRSDLDRKLNKKDSQRIKSSIDFLQEQLKSSSSNYVDKLRARILDMEKEES